MCMAPRSQAGGPFASRARLGRSTLWVPPIMEDLKGQARALGLWNLFLPGTELGAGLTNLE